MKQVQHSIILRVANELTIHVPATQTPDTPHGVPSITVPFSTGSSPGKPHISLQGSLGLVNETECASISWHCSILKSVLSAGHSYTLGITNLKLLISIYILHGNSSFHTNGYQHLFINCMTACSYKLNCNYCGCKGISESH